MPSVAGSIVFTVTLSGPASASVFTRVCCFGWRLSKNNFLSHRPGNLGPATTGATSPRFRGAASFLEPPYEEDEHGSSDVCSSAHVFAW